MHGISAMKIGISAMKIGFSRMNSDEDWTFSDEDTRIWRLRVLLRRIGASVPSKPRGFSKIPILCLIQIVRCFFQIFGLVLVRSSSPDSGMILWMEILRLCVQSPIVRYIHRRTVSGLRLCLSDAALHFAKEAGPAISFRI